MHPKHPEQLFDQGALLWGREDDNNARNLGETWVDVAMVANAISIVGGGKYRITYTGADVLNTITVTGAFNDGALGKLCIDFTGAGGNLTIQHNVGNIRTTAGVNVVLGADDHIVEFTRMPNGNVIVGNAITY